MKSLRIVLVVLAFALASSSADASSIYIVDDQGNAGVFDSVTNTGAFLGTVAGFGIGQALGAAFDPVTGRLLIIDRITDRVFTMDVGTGIGVLLMNTNGTFQGGAVSGGLLYGNSEDTQQFFGLNMPSGTVAHAGDTPGAHTHAMGVDANTGQLYTMGNDNVIRMLNANATLGGSVVTGLVGEFVDDLEYFGGNFLATQFSANTIVSIDGVTGVSSLFLSAAQLRAMGLTGNVTGVTVGGQTPIPEPATMSLLAVGLAGAAARRYRRR